MIGTRTQLIRLAERRQRLVEEARAERETLARVLRRTDEATALLERVRGIALQLRDGLRNNLWLLGAVAGLVLALRARRALGLAMKGWSAWRMYRSALRWWRAFEARDAEAA